MLVTFGLAAVIGLLADGVSNDLAPLQNVSGETGPAPLVLQLIEVIPPRPLGPEPAPVSPGASFPPCRVRRAFRRRHIANRSVCRYPTAAHKGPERLHCCPVRLHAIAMLYWTL